MSLNNDRFRLARKEGREAFLAGRNRNDAPQKLVTMADGRLLQSAAWRRAWLTGYAQASAKTLVDGWVG